MSEETNRPEKPNQSIKQQGEVKQSNSPNIFLYSETADWNDWEEGWSEYPSAKAQPANLPSTEVKTAVVRINVTDSAPLNMTPMPIETSRLRLVPLDLDGVIPLRDKTRLEPGLFRYLDLDVTRPGALDDWFVRAMSNQQRREALHFLMILKETGEIIGHSAVIAIRPEHRRCDIGWTWIFSSHQKKGYARESKRALYQFLRHCGFIRIQITVDQRNVASIRSIEASGAKCNGVMPVAQILRDGTYRDTVIYAVINIDRPRQRALSGGVQLADAE